MLTWKVNTPVNYGIDYGIEGELLLLKELRAEIAKRLYNVQYTVNMDKSARSYFDGQQDAFHAVTRLIETKIRNSHVST